MAISNIFSLKFLIFFYFTIPLAWINGEFIRTQSDLEPVGVIVDMNDKQEGGRYFETKRGGAHGFIRPSFYDGLTDSDTEKRGGAHRFLESNDPDLDKRSVLLLPDKNNLVEYAEKRAGGRSFFIPSYDFYPEWKRGGGRRFSAFDPYSIKRGDSRVFEFDGKRGGGRFFEFNEKRAGGRAFQLDDKLAGGRNFRFGDKRAGGRPFEFDEKRAGGRVFQFDDKRAGGRVFQLFENPGVSSVQFDKRAGGHIFNELNDRNNKRAGGRSFYYHLMNQPFDVKKRAGGRTFLTDAMEDSE